MRHLLRVTHTHAIFCLRTQIKNHMDEQLQYLSDNKSLQGNAAPLLPTVERGWQVGYSNLKW